MGDLTGVVGVGVLAFDEVDRVFEAAQVHEAEPHGEEGSGHDEPHDDERNLDPADGGGEEDDRRQDLGELGEGTDQGIHQGTTVTGRGETWTSFITTLPKIASRRPESPVRPTTMWEAPTSSAMSMRVSDG